MKWLVETEGKPAPYRVGVLFGAAISWLILAAVVAIPIAWWLAQVLR
jgi:hypothetical protein